MSRLRETTDRLGDAKPHPGRRLTEEEFLAWCDSDTRAEWVDGEVIIISPVNLEQAILFRFLLRLLSDYVDARDLGIVLGPEFQVRLGTQRRRRTPDLLFVARERLGIVRETEVDGAPDLVVEIVSPESRRRDREEKYREYEAAGVREYWIIEPDTRTADFHALGPDGRYRPLPVEAGAVRSTVLIGLELRPDWLWQRPLPLPSALLRAQGVL